MQLLDELKLKGLIKLASNRRYESVNAAAAHLPHGKVNDFTMRQKQPKKPTLLLFTAISKSV